MTSLTPTPAATSAPPLPETELQWVPILPLEIQHRDAILAHLQALAPEDRYLRFGHAASDEQIQRYVDGLAFERDELFGVFNKQLKLVAMSHLAYPCKGSCPVAEYGVSVSAHLRGQGFGKRLFAHAVLKARNRGTDTLLIHALTENKPMLGIARAAGATVEHHGSDSQACLKLPEADIASRWEVWLETQAAGIDFTVKQQTQRLNQLKSVLRQDK
jgi:GNAT superfamily N-acetyltransferase